MWNWMLLTLWEICYRVMKQLTWKGTKSTVKYITKKYEKGIKFSKEIMSQYEGINIHRDERLKKGIF